MRRFILWGFILVLALWNISQLSKGQHNIQIPINDFVQYWTACRAFAAGLNPYDPQILIETQRGLGSVDSRAFIMWNPPWTLPLLLPFSRLPYWVDRGLWFLFNVGLILIISDWFWRRYGGFNPHQYVIWLTAMLFIPAGSALFLGQISPLLLAGVAGFLWALERKWYFASGAFLLLISVKPHVLYLFWFFLLAWIIRQRRWNILGGGFAALLLCSSLAFYFNPRIFGQYVNSISSSNLASWQTPTWGILILTIFPGLAVWVKFTPALAGLIAACMLWREWRQDFSWLEKLPTIFFLSITTTSYTWTFDWIVLLPIILLIVIWFAEDPFNLWWLFAGLALILFGCIFQIIAAPDYFYTIWLPPALWLLYWTGKRARAFAGTKLDTIRH